MNSRLVSKFGRRNLDIALNMGLTHSQIEEIVLNKWEEEWEGKFLAWCQRVEEYTNPPSRQLGDKLRSRARVLQQMSVLSADCATYLILQDAYTTINDQIRRLERIVNPPSRSKNLDIESAKLVPIGDLISPHDRTYDSTERATYKCPFHKEKTGSMVWYKKNNTFYCFGCGAGGDVIEFTMKIFQIPFVQAVRKLTS